MTGAQLFITSRRWLVVAGVSLATGLLLWAAGHATYTLIPRGEFPIAVAQQVPLLPAIAIQATLHPGLHTKELVSSRSLRPWRGAHIIILTTAAAVAIVLGTALAAAVSVPPEFANAAALVRNLLALTGAALIASAVVGQWFAWTVPLAWLVLPYLFIPRPSEDPIGILTLTAQDGDEAIPFAVACAVWSAGAVLHIFWAPRRMAILPR